MEPRHLADVLGDASARLAALVDEALARDDDHSGDMVRRLLQELATGIEELRVAEEELVVQAEQLAASHDVIDAERERYGRLFEFAPDGYVETDGLGKILEANSAAASLLGVPVRLLVGKLLVSFVAEADRRRVRRLVSEAAKGSAEGELRVALVPRHGEAFPVGMRVASDAGPAEGSARLRWLLRDIRERVQLELERQALQEELDLVLSLGEVSRLTACPDPLAPVLDGVVEVASGAVEGEVSVTLLDAKGRFTTAAASADVAAELSDLQHARGGPCTESARTGTAFALQVDDLPTEWAPLGDAIADRGFVQVLALPLHVDGAGAGSLNVYLRREVTAVQRRTLDVLTGQAAAGIGNAQLYQRSAELASQLHTALDHRSVIERAKGMLMVLQRCDEDEAFDILRRASQRRNQKLWLVAGELVERTIEQLRAPGGDTGA
jgi:PAS domain S-box-containing protein